MKILFGVLTSLFSVAFMVFPYAPIFILSTIFLVIYLIVYFRTKIQEEKVMLFNIDLIEDKIILTISDKCWSWHGEKLGQIERLLGVGLSDFRIYYKASKPDQPIVTKYLISSEQAKNLMEKSKCLGMK